MTTDIPMSIKSELFRLSSVLDLDCYYDINDILEEDCVELLAGAIRSIERIKYENQNQASVEKPKINTNGVDKKLMKKAKSLENDLRLSLGIVEDVGALKAKNMKLMTNMKKEKEQRSVMEDFISSQNKKIKILVEHIEKLMKALKIESAAKVRGLDDTRALHKEQVLLTTKVEKQERIMATQLRLIRQVSEGSKILEDQLLLMDEKYVDLRTKLDINRTQLQAQITKVRKEMDALRLKYSLANGGALLDNVSMKKLQHQQQLQQQQTMYGGTGTVSFDMTRTDGIAQSCDPNNTFEQFRRASSGSARPSTANNNFDSNDGDNTKFNPSKVRPVSAFASSSPTNHTSSGQEGFISQQMHPNIQPGGKIRPSTATAASRQQQANQLNQTAPGSSSNNYATTSSPKVFNNYSRSSQYNPGELNLDKVVKKINRKQKLSRTDSWAPGDLQDLLNG